MPAMTPNDPQPSAFASADSDAPLAESAMARTRLATAFSLFSNPLYRRLGVSGVIYSLGTWAERLATGWLVLIQTDSILASASTMAIRAAPGIIFAPFAGALADRLPRQRVLATAVFSQAVITLLIGFVAFGGISSSWSVLPLVALLGIASSFSTPATHALTADIVGRQRVMSGISVYATGARAVGVVGALIAGVLSDHAGPAAALFVAAGVLFVSASVMITINAPQTVRADKRAGVLSATTGMVKTMSGNPAIATLLVMALAVEIFGFAYQAVLPAVARDVLHVRATGYGSLSFMAGVGAVIGVAVLSLLGNYPHKGRLVLGVTFGFGFSMLAFAASTSLPISLFLILGLGAAAAMFDAMQWTLLQTSVPDEMRGRAVAAWVFAIGFGWIGHLTLGAIAEGAGVRWALVASGCMLLVTGVAGTLAFRRIRIE